MNMSNIKNTWKGINLLINGKTRGDNVITALKLPEAKSNKPQSLTDSHITF